MWNLPVKTSTAEHGISRINIFRRKRNIFVWGEHSWGVNKWGVTFQIHSQEACKAGKKLCTIFDKLLCIEFYAVIKILSTSCRLASWRLWSKAHVKSKLHPLMLKLLYKVKKKPQTKHNNWKKKRIRERNISYGLQC